MSYVAVKKIWGLTRYARVVICCIHLIERFAAAVSSTIIINGLCSIADLLIDFDMNVYEVNETEGIFIIEVELTSQIEREIQLLLMTEDGKATG